MHVTFRKSGKHFTSNRRITPSSNFSNQQSKTPGREHLLDDGRRGYDHIEKFGIPIDTFHHPRDPHTGRDPNYVHQNVISERGKSWVVGKDIGNDFERDSGFHQEKLPITIRKKLLLFGNYSLLMKLEYIFFHVPAILILGLIIPAVTMSFMNDEAVYTTMTVKVTGRQWYWVYDVECPPLEEEQEETNSEENQES